MDDFLFNCVLEWLDFYLENLAVQILAYSEVVRDCCAFDLIVSVTHVVISRLSLT